MSRKDVGNIGENIASKYLKAKGFRIVERNFRCRMGEIDIIADKDGDLYFVEVKTRKNERYGTPFESITLKKQQKIVKIAQYFLLRAKKEVNCHFSVVGIMLGNQENHKVDFLENAFQVS